MERDEGIRSKAEGRKVRSLRVLQCDGAEGEERRVLEDSFKEWDVVGMVET